MRSCDVTSHAYAPQEGSMHMSTCAPVSIHCSACAVSFILRGGALAAGSDGQYLHGWEQQFDFLSTKWADVPQAQRRPQAMWRGRTEDPDFPKRDELRRASTPGPNIASQNSQEPFNSSSASVHLLSCCHHRALTNSHEVAVKMKISIVFPTDIHAPANSSPWPSVYSQVSCISVGCGGRCLACWAC